MVASAKPRPRGRCSIARLEQAIAASVATYASSPAMKRATPGSPLTSSRGQRVSSGEQLRPTEEGSGCRADWRSPVRTSERRRARCSIVCRIDGRFRPEYNVDFDVNKGNANVVIFHDDEWPHPTLEFALALTTVTYDAETGEIYDADIEINTFGIEFTTSDTDVAYDLLTTLQYETGHSWAPRIRPSETRRFTRGPAPGP